MRRDSAWVRSSASLGEETRTLAATLVGAPQAGDVQMKTARYYPTRHSWAVCLLLAALVLGFDARSAVAQGQAQTFTGDVTISGEHPRALPGDRGSRWQCRRLPDGAGRGWELRVFDEVRGPIRW